MPTEIGNIAVALRHSPLVEWRIFGTFVSGQKYDSHSAECEILFMQGVKFPLDKPKNKVYNNLTKKLQ